MGAKHPKSLEEKISNNSYLDVNLFMVVGSIESNSEHYGLPQPPTTTMPTIIKHSSYDKNNSLLISKLIKEASGFFLFYT